ncbi:GumC family protein [Hyphomicrobium sp.]|uniref:GumC family protein n=1 Tax=Hyphomicrobium sp. TaxID=82 RepID=UPI003F72B823
MMMSSNYAMAAQEAHAGPTDFSGLLAVLRRRSGEIAASTLIALGLAVAYLVVTPPTYTSSSVLYINPLPNRVVNEERLAPNSSGADLAIVDSQVSIIGSDAMMQRVVETLSLDTDSEFTGTGPLTKLRTLFSASSDAVPAKALAAAKLAKKVKIIRAPRTYIVEVEVSSGSAAKAAQIADTLVSLYLANQTSARADDERRANELINSRLGELREQVRKAEDRVDEFKQRNRITVSEGGMFDEQQLGKLNGELATARATAAEAKSRLESIRAARSTKAALDSMPEAVRSPTIQRLREQHAQVSRRVASLESQLKGRHPVMIEARSQLGEIQAEIDAELRRLSGALTAEHDVASRRERELQTIIETSKTEVSRSSTAQIKLRELQQDVATSRDVLGTFLQRAKETREQEQISIPYARVVSPATAPAVPSWPINILVLGLGAFAGLGFGIVRALAGEQLAPTVRSTSRAPALSEHALFPVPSLVSGPPSLLKLGRRGATLRAENGEGELGRALVAVSEPDGPADGAYRQSILQLLAAFEQDRHQDYPTAVMMVGASHGTGTSSVALAIAQAGALRGERVLLVDACSSAAALSAALAPDISSDWATLLAKPEALTSHTVRDAKSSLAFLPLAPADLRLLKRAERRRLAANLAAAALDYDLVIIDAGPLAQDESGSALLPLADRIAIVTRSGVTSQSALDDTLRVLAPMLDKVAGIVLNDADARRT